MYLVSLVHAGGEKNEKKKSSSKMKEGKRRSKKGGGLQAYESRVGDYLVSMDNLYHHL